MLCLSCVESGKSPEVDCVAIFTKTRSTTTMTTTTVNMDGEVTRPMNWNLDSVIAYIIGPRRSH